MKDGVLEKYLEKAVLKLDKDGTCLKDSIASKMPQKASGLVIPLFQGFVLVKESRHWVLSGNMKMNYN